MTVPIRRFINVNVAFASFAPGESIGDESIDTSGDMYLWKGDVLGWEPSGAGGITTVTGEVPTSMETSERLALPSDGVSANYVYHNLIVDDTELGYDVRYIGDGTTNLEADWERAYAVITDAGGVSVNPTLLSGEDQINNVIRVEGQFDYETVAASQTAQALGATGAVGDLLHSIIITASTGTITVLDNAVTVAVIPAGALGVWYFDLVSVSGAWKITTAASTSCTAVGRFT